MGRVYHVPSLLCAELSLNLDLLIVSSQDISLRNAIGTASAKNNNHGIGPGVPNARNGETAK